MLQTWLVIFAVVISLDETHPCWFQSPNGIWNIFGGKLDWGPEAIVCDDPNFQGCGNPSSGILFYFSVFPPNFDELKEENLVSFLPFLEESLPSNLSAVHAVRRGYIPCSTQYWSFKGLREKRYKGVVKLASKRYWFWWMAPWLHKVKVFLFFFEWNRGQRPKAFSYFSVSNISFFIFCWPNLFFCSVCIQIPSRIFSI